MEITISKYGSTLTRMTSKEAGVSSRTKLKKQNSIKDEKKEIFKYGMTKKEYDNYLDNLYK